MGAADLGHQANLGAAKGLTVGQGNLSADGKNFGWVLSRCTTTEKQQSQHGPESRRLSHGIPSEEVQEHVDQPQSRERSGDVVSPDRSRLIKGGLGLVV